MTSWSTKVMLSDALVVGVGENGDHGRLHLSRRRDGDARSKRQNHQGKYRNAHAKHCS